MSVILAFISSSIPGTYTVGVRNTPNQSDFSKSCDQGKITNKAWKLIMDV